MQNDLLLSPLPPSDRPHMISGPGRNFDFLPVFHAVWDIQGAPRNLRRGFSASSGILCEYMKHPLFFLGKAFRFIQRRTLGPSHQYLGLAEPVNQPEFLPGDGGFPDDPFGCRFRDRFSSRSRLDRDNPEEKNRRNSERKTTNPFAHPFSPDYLTLLPPRHRNSRNSPATARNGRRKMSYATRPRKELAPSLPRIRLKSRRRR